MTSSLPRVLIVDDSEIVCESVKHSLEAQGFKVACLASPFGFIKAVREFEPAIILVDIGLGSMNGTRLIQLGRQHAAPGTQILLYSGSDAPTSATDLQSADANSSGADGFISKNVIGVELASLLKDWLQKSS